MNALLLAYEFPPVLSAQSLRWYYLAEELAVAGIQLTVLAPRIRGRWQFDPALSTDVVINRCFPGPFIGLSGWLARGLQAPDMEGNSRAADDSRGGLLSALRAMGERVYRGLRSALDQVVFTDIRSEWYPFAWAALQQLLQHQHIDVLISSYEPGVDLQLGLKAQRRLGVPWVADMADPLVTLYTPRWRRALDRRLEAKVCARADHILVTNAQCARLLASRHRTPEGRFTVVSQGFNSRQASGDDAGADSDEDGTFTLTFTGNFYSGFRDPAAFAETLSTLDLPHLRCVVAGADPRFRDLFRPLGGRLQWLGQLDHFATLRLQRTSTVLVNLGNRQSEQVPGKLFEYFGACRPILHIAGSRNDPSVGLLLSLNRGIACPNQVKDIATAIDQLYRAWERRELEKGFDLSLAAVRDYSWEVRAKTIAEVLRSVTAAHQKSDPPPRASQSRRGV